MPTIWICESPCPNVFVAQSPTTSGCRAKQRMFPSPLIYLLCDSLTRKTLPLYQALFQSSLDWNSKPDQLLHMLNQPQRDMRHLHPRDLLYCSGIDKVLWYLGRHIKKIGISNQGLATLQKESTSLIGTVLVGVDTLEQAQKTRVHLIVSLTHFKLCTLNNKQLGCMYSMWMPSCCLPFYLIFFNFLVCVCVCWMIVACDSVHSS